MILYQVIFRKDDGNELCKAVRRVLCGVAIKNFLLTKSLKWAIMKKIEDVLGCSQRMCNTGGDKHESETAALCIAFA